jgi:S-adenosylmethionine hydrolase
MLDATITLTTDFGEESPYVAAMKGVILSINANARLLDLSHQIPPQDVRYTAFFLAAALPYFAREVIHLIVVDPGVGTERALLYVEANGHRLLVPDNGCWTELLRGATREPRVIRLAEPHYWRAEVSHTFHGRDILAPVAGHLSLGLEPEVLGPRIQKWVSLDLPIARAGANSLIGEVIFVDHFGNLITNIPAEKLRSRPEVLIIGKTSRRRFHWGCSYAEADPGTIVVLISSGGTLEVAVNQGNAARKLRAKVGTSVQIRWKR